MSFSLERRLLYTCASKSGNMLTSEKKSKKIDNYLNLIASLREFYPLMYEVFWLSRIRRNMRPTSTNNTQKSYFDPKSCSPSIRCGY